MLYQAVGILVSSSRYLTVSVIAFPLEPLKRRRTDWGRWDGMRQCRSWTQRSQSVEVEIPVPAKNPPYRDAACCHAGGAPRASARQEAAGGGVRIRRMLRWGGRFNRQLCNLEPRWLPATTHSAARARASFTTSGLWAMTSSSTLAACSGSTPALLPVPNGSGAETEPERKCLSTVSPSSRSALAAGAGGRGVAWWRCPGTLGGADSFDRYETAALGSFAPTGD